MSKTFTMGEAQIVLPVLETLLKRAQQTAGRGEELEAAMEDLRQRIFLFGGTHVNVSAAARGRAERQKSLEETRDTLAEIGAIGAEVHDLRGGLLDLPFQLEGGVVMLCWRVGEREIGYWHEAEEEPKERRPLDGRFGLDGRDRPN